MFKKAVSMEAVLLSTTAYVLVERYLVMHLYLKAQSRCLRVALQDLALVLLFGWLLLFS